MYRQKSCYVLGIPSLIVHKVYLGKDINYRDICRVIYYHDDEDREKIINRMKARDIERLAETRKQLPDLDFFESEDFFNMLNDLRVFLIGKIVTTYAENDGYHDTHTIILFLLSVPDALRRYKKNAHIYVSRDRSNIDPRKLDYMCRDKLALGQPPYLNSA